MGIERGRDGCGYKKSRMGAPTKDYHANNVVVALASKDDLTPRMKLRTASSIVKGTLLGTSEDKRFKSEYKKPTLKLVDLFVYAAKVLAKDAEKITSTFSGVLAEESSNTASTYSAKLTTTISDTEQCK
ncbi:hypothetical protein OSB04_012619 [Centaurea solstitialis]|uniref:Uncharacterized protein n=1 Tax=Centaurea solstitialis TaxID=347529 RepID=A0AA38WML2_9ASTR|nr:hypothetical protein OSB04_012619 [Centaurea solstitialis]